MASDKSVKTCLKFRQGWSRIMAAFAGFDHAPLFPQVTVAARPFSGRGNYPAACPICRQPLLALARGPNRMNCGLSSRPEPVQNPIQRHDWPRLPATVSSEMPLRMNTRFSSSVSSAPRTLLAMSADPRCSTQLESSSTAAPRSSWF